MKNWKKIGMGIVVAMVTATMLVGCGSTKATDSNGNEFAVVANAKPADCIKVGTLEGIDLGEKYEASEADIQELAESMVRTENPDKVIESEEDYIAAIYEGRLNGESFEGSDGIYGGYIKDWDINAEVKEALIGMKAGEDKTIEVPADNEGDIKAYRITIQSVFDVGEITDEIMEQAREQMSENVDTTNQAVAASVAWSNLVAESELLKMPKEAYQRYVKNYEDACMESMNVDTIAKYMETAGITEEDYAKAKDDYVIRNVKNELALLVIGEQKGYTEDSKEYQDAYQEFLTSLNMAEEEAIAEYGKERIHNTVLYNLITKYIVDNGVYKDSSES